MAEGAKLVTGGTDNHLMVIDTVASFGLDGRPRRKRSTGSASRRNKQVIPDDPRPPLRPSGVRLGTPACTTRGMNEDDMRRLAAWMVATLRAPDDKAAIERRRGDVTALCRAHPVPGIG